jgi:hypothetical protein
MDINLTRFEKTEDYTVGNLEIPNKFKCFTIEDMERKEGEKVYGLTAIPKGRYKVIVIQSPKFERRLPLLINVPNFEGIRIHAGNNAEASHGCILPNLVYLGEGIGTNSKMAEDILIVLIDNAIKKGEDVFINIQ